MIVFKIIYVVLKLGADFYGAFAIVYNLFAINDIPLTGKTEGGGYAVLTILTVVLGYYINGLLNYLINRGSAKYLKNKHGTRDLLSELPSDSEEGAPDSKQNEV